MNICAFYSNAATTTRSVQHAKQSWRITGPKFGQLSHHAFPCTPA